MATQKAISPLASSRIKTTSSAAVTEMPTSPIDILEGGPLFRPGFPLDDVRCLPFVRSRTKAEQKIQGAGRSFWSCPPSTDYDRACEIGKLYAAAWLTFQRINGPQWAPLTWITRDMPVKNDGYSVGFLGHVALYAWSNARLMEPNEIEDHARASIERERKVVADARASGHLRSRKQS